MMMQLEFDRSDVGVISSDGDRFVVKPVESEIARELIRLGSVSPRGLKRNILVPFSTVTVKYLLSICSVSTCSEEQDWLQLERSLEEVVGYAKQYPVIRKFRDEFCDHLISTLEDSNCFLMHKKFTEFDCEDYAGKTLEYIKYNLIRMVVVEHTVDVEFFRLPAEDLKTLLQCDDINLEAELQIVELINKWIAAAPSPREKFRPMLFGAVRLYSLSPETSGMFADFHLSSEPCRKSRDVLMVVGGWLHKQACDRIEWFDAELGVWKTCAQTLPMEVAYHGSAIIDDHLYIFGGSNGLKSRCETWKVSPRNNWQWQRCDNMMEARNYISNSSVVYDGKIYAFGGQSWRDVPRVHQRSATGECYDPKTDRWTATANLHDMRSDCAAAVHGDQIFVAGGFNGDIIIDTVEVYNPLGDFFVRHVSLPYPVSGHCLIGHRNRLFVVGGFSGVEREARILVWHPRTGEWRQCEEQLGKARSTSSVCSFRGGVAVAGGYTNRVEGSCETVLLAEPNGLAPMLPPIPRAKSALKLLVAPNWRAHLESRGLMSMRRAPDDDELSEDYCSMSAMSTNDSASN